MNPWLTALTVIAATNPVRRGVALGAAKPAVVGAGAAAALAVLVGLAAVASSLVSDVVRVSPPTFRVAAGLVVALAALVALVRRAQRAVPGLDERGAWAAPVAFPHLLGPATVFGIAALGTDHGVALGGVTALIAVGLTAAVSRLKSRIRKRWSAAVDAVGLVGGLALLAAGVIAV